jgi:hypothetical protein
MAADKQIEAGEVAMAEANKKTTKVIKSTVPVKRKVKKAETEETETYFDNFNLFEMQTLVFALRRALRGFKQDLSEIVTDTILRSDVESEIPMVEALIQKLKPEFESKLRDYNEKFHGIWPDYLASVLQSGPLPDEIKNGPPDEGYELHDDQTVTVHPICEAYPFGTDAEFDSLVESIRRTGLLNPIILYENQILDGKRRYKACFAAGVKPKFLEYFKDDPMGYVEGVHLGRCRMELTEEQKCKKA